MKVTGWIIGCASCLHAAIARMPYADAVREAHRQGWRRRLRAGRAWACCYCTGAQLPEQPKQATGRVRRAS